MLFDFFRRKKKTVPTANFIPDPNFLRGYAAAKINPSLVNWSGSMGLSPQQIRDELPVVRAKCRDLMFNSSVCVRAMDMLKAAIVGDSGFKISCDVSKGNSRGNKTSMDDSDIVERDWNLWANTPEFCSLDGTQTLTEMLWAACESWFRDGEALIELVPLPSSDPNPFKFSLKLHRADILDEKLIRPEGDRPIYNGVEVDRSTGRVIGYHFLKSLGSSGQFISEGGHKVIPAGRIVHLFSRQYADQRRGFPLYAAACVEIRQLDALRDAEIWAARKEAARTGTWQMMEAALEPGQVATQKNGMLYQELAPGQDRITPPGWEYHEQAPMHPSQNFAVFCKLLNRGIASGLGLNYNLLFNDAADVNYSTSRTMIQQDRENYRLLQSKMISSVLLPIFRRPSGWASQYCLSGISKFTTADFMRIAASPTYIPHSWQWIDLTAEVETNERLIALGVKTKEQLAAEMGQDWYKLQKDLKQEQEWESREGVTKKDED